jgi:hypothetical protein
VKEQSRQDAKPADLAAFRAKKRGAA